jgi:DNA-binding transcriptional LysR family regulator
MNNLQLDLNLLVVFDAVLRHRSVSRAAEAVGLSQPAVSNGLRRLREHFHDRLFVRTAEGMVPTPAAEALGGSVSAALAQLGAGLARRAAFDPRAETRTFTLIMTDIGEVVFLPRLLETAKRAAPGISFRTVHLPAAATRRALESGEADLAVGYVPDLEVGVFQQRLFATEYVCMARSDHPAIGDRVTRAQFMAATHAIADAEGTGHYVVAQALARLRPAPRIGLRVPQFLALPLIVGASDMLATVPLPLAYELRRAANVKLLAHPLRLPRIEIRQFWHERYHDDPANRWLRGTIVGLFKDARWV